MVSIKGNIFQRVKGTLGAIESLIGQDWSGEFLVVNYHGTQYKFIENFEAQIRFYTQNFDIISPDEVREGYTKGFNANTPKLLLTFDDGIKNNLLAVDVLNRYNIRAAFFIIPDFINTGEEGQAEYFKTNIRKPINPEIDNKSEDFTAMSWDDIRELHAQGHAIGSHTMSHTLHRKHSNEKIKYEIIQSKIEIEKAIGNPIDMFCSINNSLESMSLKSLQFVQQNYKYHFTTLPGNNLKSLDPLFIRRINVESHWELNAIKFALGKVDRLRWRSRVNTFKLLLGQYPRLPMA